MKKRKIKKTIPAYAFGLGQGADAANILGTAFQSFGGGNGTLSDIGGIVGSTGSMASTGFMAGGPVGAGIGGGLGLASGILGLLNKNKREKQAAERFQNVTNQRLADSNTASMIQDYYGQNQLANTFAMGGVMPGDLAYVDNGELIKTPDGRINEVTAGNANTTDGVLTNLPEGSGILSDKLKVPGTNKTFAQMGRGLQRKIKNRDAFAMNSEKLNSMNFDKLLAYQEQVKLENGITNKQKSIPGYAKGGITRKVTAPLIAPDINNLNTALPTNNKMPSMASLSTDLAAAMPSIESRAQDTLSKQAAYDATPKANTRSFDYGNLAALAPALYNIGQSFAKPEVETVTPNPYVGNVNKLMASRRMNVQPGLTANKRSRAISNYNLSQLNTNTGANLAARTQMAAGEYSANADLYSNMQNANNAYMGEQAQMLGNLGNQHVGNRMAVDDINARNRAARRGFGSTAVSQLGQWSQSQQLMKNAANRDDLMMPFLMQNLGQGYTSDLINQLRTKYYGNK